MNKYSSLTHDLIINLELADKFQDYERIVSKREDAIDTLKNKISPLNDGYFIELFDEIVYVSFVLRIEDSNLQEPLSQVVQDNIDDVLKILKSDNILTSMQIMLDNKDINRDNYLDVLKEKHESFTSAFEWVLREIANTNKDLGSILIKLK